MDAALKLVELDSCESTQDEVRARLAGAAPHGVVAVVARSQGAGRGREGRRWEDPPGGALLVSVGVRGPLPIAVLDALPARLGEALLLLLDPDARAICWKAPNDLVAIVGGDKVAGILVDARTTGTDVDEVVVGFGCNVDGAAFTTSDGRAATTLQACGSTPPSSGAVVAAILDQLRVSASG